MRALRIFVLLAGIGGLSAGPAVAQFTPDSIGNGGRMPQTMSPGALPPPATPPPPTISTPSSPYPSTQSLTRDRIESQGYRVQRLQQAPSGDWKADVTRDPTPTRPQGTPSRIIIHPDGSQTVEY